MYDGDELVAEYDLSGTLAARYVHGRSTDDPLVWYEGPGIGDRRYLHTDERGSITGIAGTDGRIRSINSYDAWGIPALTNEGRFGYTGQIWLRPLGIWYYKARIYSPTLGRFMQTDLIGYEDQVNLYAYVGNDPVNGSDPTGKVAVLAACVPPPGAAACAAVVVKAVEAVITIACIIFCDDVVDKVFNESADEESTKNPDEDQESDPTAGPDGKSGSDGGPGAGKRFKPETPDAKAAKEGVPCRYCGRPTTNQPGRPNSRERDHIKPKSRGGNNSSENEGDSCRTCNRRKGATDPDDFLKKRNERK